MKAIVLGGGVIGVTSAYYLAKLGVDVTVIERQNNVAEETSFGNAGQISPDYSTPWAAPGIPLKAAKWLLRKTRTLRHQSRWISVAGAVGSQDVRQLQRRSLRS